MELKFSVRNGLNLGIPQEVVLFFRRVLKKLFHSPLEISGNAGRTFWSNGNRQLF